MENNEQMTIRRALEVTKEILDGISVPVAMLDQIGAPLRAASENLGIMIEGIDRAEKAEEERNNGAGNGVSV